MAPCTACMMADLSLWISRLDRAASAYHTQTATALTCVTADVCHSRRVLQLHQTRVTADMFYSRRMLQRTCVTVNMCYSRRVLQRTCVTDSLIDTYSG